MAGLDRYETVTWRMIRDDTRGYGLRVRGRAKSYAPPFMMLGMTLENTTSSDFNISATARYLAFDRSDQARSGASMAPWARIRRWRRSLRPIRPTPLFVAPYAAIGRRTFNVISDDSVIARYRQDVSRVGLNVGVNLGAQSDVRVGAYVGRTTASITVGNPGFPELAGKETGAEIAWRVDTQDSPVVPSRGMLLQRTPLAHFRRPQHRGGRRARRLCLVADAVVGNGESILERWSAQSRVPLRRFGHVVRRRTAADRSVRAGHAVQARRL